MISTLHAKRLLALVAAATLGALPLLRPDSARCAEPPTQNHTNRSSSSDAKRQLDQRSAELRREAGR